MKLFHIFKNKKILLLNIFLFSYVSINLIGGERGLYSYFEKKEFEKNLIKKEKILSNNLKIIEKKNRLLSDKIDLDYLDIMFREKFKAGKKEEIIIKIR